MAVYKTAIPAEPEPTQTFRMIQKGMVIKMSGVTKVEKKVLSSDGIHQLAGWVYLPDRPARGLLQVVPVQDAIFRRDFNILYHPDKYQTKPARDFLALCQEAGDDLEE